MVVAMIVMQSTCLLFDIETIPFCASKIVDCTSYPLVRRNQVLPFSLEMYLCKYKFLQRFNASQETATSSKLIAQTFVDHQVT
jgi:hypothetical protein